MKDWERIRKARPDITDYAFHWVRPKYEGGKITKSLAILAEIIENGYLKPTFATRSSIYDRSKRPTVKGPYPTVCFTEQSLEDFIKSCQVLPNCYHPYGIALYKRVLYQYGGRPVIYGQEDILGELVRPNEPDYETGKEIYKNGLPKDCQYLWVRYEPIPNEDGYVVDWTHEREWRSRARIYHDLELGFTPEEGVPLLLPALYDFESNQWIHYLPKILVSKRQEKEFLDELIQLSMPEWIAQCQDKYLQSYFKALPKAKVIALGELPEHPEAYELEWVVSKRPSTDASEI